MKRYLQFSIATLCLMVAVLIGFHLAGRYAHATVVTAPAGPVIAAAADYVVTTDGNVWMWAGVTRGWEVYGLLPIPVDQLHFLVWEGGGPHFVTTSGDFYEIAGAGAWINRGHPSVTVPTESETIGGVKGKYK